MTVITDATVDLIKRWEGLRLDAYRDQAGVWTIGYGHSERAPLPPKPVSGMRITEDEAESILRADLEHFAEEVRPLVPEDLPPHVFGAVLSLAFNIGVGAFKGSTARRRLEAGDVEGAAEALTWWNKVTVGGRKIVSRGLANRRAAEKAFMLRHTSSLPPSIVVQPTPETAPAKSSKGEPVVDQPTDRTSRKVEYASRGAGFAGLAAAVLATWTYPSLPTDWQEAALAEEFWIGGWTGLVTWVASLQLGRRVRERLDNMLIEGDQS